MDVREKLVGLIDTATFGVNKQTIPSYLPLSAIAEVADHLIAHGVTVQEWISVKDRLPEKYGKYLALTPGYLKGFDQYNAWLIYYHPESGFYDTDPRGDIPIDDVTHWRPLPPAPEENK